MNFQRNILGLAVLASTLALSGTAISADLSAPDAVTGIPATAPIATAIGAGTTVASVNTYTNVVNALTALGSATTAAATDVKELAAIDLQIATSNTKIAAAQALTAGSLIGGKTGAQIVATERGLLGVNLTTGVYTAGTAGYMNNRTVEAAAGVTTAATKATATAALAALTAGGISNSMSLGLQAAALETSTGTANGIITGNATGVALASQTPGMKVQYATTALGTANTAAAGATFNSTGLRLAADNAAKAVTTAAALITGGNGATAYTSATTYQATAVTGVDKVDHYTLADVTTAGTVIDIRDGTKQVLWTIGSASNATANTGTIAELITAINAKGMKFTAALGTANATDIALTHTNTNLGTTYAAGVVGQGANAAAAAAAPVTKTADGTADSVATTLYVAQKLTTYDVNLAEVTLLSTKAASAVSVAVADLASKTAVWNAAETLEASYKTAEALNLTAAGKSLATVTGVLNEDLAVKNAATAVLEKTALAAEAITAADVADVTTTAAAVATATANVTAAAATRDAAQAAFVASSTSANSTAYSAALTAYNTAVAAKTTATTAATAATNVLYGVGKTAATVLASQTGTNATSATARKAVVTSQAVATAATAFQNMQVQMLDTANPAGALQKNLITGTDTGAGVVTAVNANYQFAKGLSAGIDTNTASIATNTATLVTHAGLVTKNIADIATNVTNIATNSAGIAANTASIAGFSTELASVQMQQAKDTDMLKSGIASALAIAGMPIAPGEGMGFSIGTGHFDGESAIAMGITFVSENKSFQLSVGNSGGETSASAGAAFKF